MKTIALLLLTFVQLSFAVNSHQKAILVTGASSGIGKNITENLASKGYFVYAGARKKADIEALSAMKNVQGIRLDVTIQSDIDAAVKQIQQQGKGLYGIVNNAGVAVLEPMIEVSEETMQFQMDVNLFGPYRVTKAFAPLIIESAGRVVNISSLLGVTAGALTGPYSMSKHALEAFTDSLAAELKKFQVNVSVVEPGNYNSNVIKSMRARMNKYQTNNKDSAYMQEQENIKKYIPADRSQFKPPTEVSNAVIHALFDDNPKRRYMVVPNQREAEMTIKGMIRKLVQLNQSQAYSFDREKLIELLDAASH